MNLVNRPVLIKSGDFSGHVGMVTAFEFGLYLVERGGVKSAHADAELQPLFTPQEVKSIRTVEVDDDGHQIDGALEQAVKPFGITSDDLADFTTEFLAEAVTRIKGTGNDQYSNGTYQKFEGKTLLEILTDMQEEALDLGNYAAMFFVLVERLKRAVDTIEGEDDA